MIKKIIEVEMKKTKYKKLGTVLRTINISKNASIGHNCIVGKRVIIEDNVEVGNFTYFNSNKYWITIESNVKIGSFCSIAPGVHVGAGNHEYKYVTTHPILFDKYYEKKINIPKNLRQVEGLKDKEKETLIGNDVWIGLNSIIKRGIKIGNGAVIAAGSVVVKDVPEYAIVGGNPARIIKYRTSEENIEFLKENEDIMFWNWKKDDLVNHINKLYDFEQYINYLRDIKSKQGGTINEYKR